MDRSGSLVEANEREPNPCDAMVVVVVVGGFEGDPAVGDRRWKSTGMRSISQKGGCSVK